ncbi:hypothetical protein C1646_754068 [Rhizophagus diaphanus]|nr:hypothetical protein C1646_754068 [Rhizophagus diaphanus] [Rhizophagus sp. MUCL 43196]
MFLNYKTHNPWSPSSTLPLLKKKIYFIFYSPPSEFGLNGLGHSFYFVFLREYLFGTGFRLEDFSFLDYLGYWISVSWTIWSIGEEILPSVGFQIPDHIFQHKRKNVVIYQEEFLEVIDRYQKLMPKFISKECKTQVNPELKDGECLHVLFIYVEMTFQSNNGQKSDTIDIDDRISHEVCIIINSGKNFDRCYAKLADDTLNATNMNLNPDGKQPTIHDTIFNRQVQSTVFSADYPDEKLYRKLKG